jgi:hypothetical protein
MTSADHDNAHFLAVLADARARLTVVSAEDIEDGSGFKLISKDQEITPALQLRMAQRGLLKPIEASLGVKDGVTADDLEREAVRQCQGSAFLAAVVGRDFIRLRHLYHSVPLHPFVRLLLSVQQVARPKLFSHSVLGSILAGALVLKAEGPLVNAQLALLAGLLHDCGELYIDPIVANRTARSSRDQWREIATHAETGSRILDQFTDCPKSIAQAVFEHHEKIDGSGYPRGLSEHQVSPLGRVLSVVETICEVIGAPDNHGARAKLAVSFITGEYDPHVVRVLAASIGGTLTAEIALPPGFDSAEALQRARVMSTSLNAAHQSIERLAQTRIEDKRLAELVEFARHRIERLKSSWEATGIGEYFAAAAAPLSPPGDDEESYFDLDVVTSELIWRMRTLARQIGFSLHQRRLAGYDALESVILALELES